MYKSLAVDTSNIRILAEKVAGIPPKKFREGGKEHYRVRIYIEGSADELNKLTAVKYQLHPSFRKRERLSVSRERSFETVIWTWGYFPVAATLISKDGTENEIEGYLKF